jgi:ferredoxin-type protein NapG
MNRRRFFREGLREFLRPLAGLIEPLEETARQLGALAETPLPQSPPPVTTSWLRPPGALDEQTFRLTCTRSGECVRSCPVQCIKIDYSGINGAGAPYIDVESTACVVCDGLLCMQACPSGALVPTALTDIDMGTAVWHEDTCLRREGNPCTICVDKCPLGATAIVLREGQVEVIAEGCIGCGVCQHECPTTPRSIRVTPRTVPDTNAV